MALLCCGSDMLYYAAGPVEKVDVTRSQLWKLCVLCDSEADGPLKTHTLMCHFLMFSTAFDV